MGQYRRGTGSSCGLLGLPQDKLMHRQARQRLRLTLGTA